METFLVKREVGNGKSIPVAPTQAQWDAEFKRVVASLKKKLKPKQLSQELDTPEMAEEYKRLTEQQVWHKDLNIRCKLPKRDAKGNVVKTKKGATMTTWVPLSVANEVLQSEANECLF